ncbi:MAG TPA: cell wall hydrolase [Bacillota bacterium]|nr:cell wall hydrolase [Bacillota bacterium]
MTKEKHTGDRASWTVYILIALMFGAFLGSPIPDAWAGKITKAVSGVTEQTVKTVNLHNATADQAPAARDAADSDRSGADSETAHTDISGTDSETAQDAGINMPVSANENETASGVQMIVSDPLPPAQPDYILSNANRGGIADRKERDVLVHLINAEAYGLSYKAKVAVGQVVMNRWTGPYYGNDLLAIMTAPHQFTPIYNGSAYKKKIEPSSIEAANAVLAGNGVKELTDDTYYFVNPDFTQDKTIETKMTFVCEIEGIHFYKPPAKAK